MNVSFPAMKATMGKREYYSCVVSLAEIPRLFTFADFDLPPEQREQRQLNKSRITPLRKYILENEEGYVFSSIVASYKGEATFTPSEVSDILGMLEMDLAGAKFVINDGQHRAAGITAALRENPDLGSESISVLLFPYESLDRVQQMFSDLNRYVVKTPQALNILFDRRDQLAQATLESITEVPVFQQMVDKERTSLPTKAAPLFTLSALYEANREFLTPQTTGNGEDTPVMLYEDKVKAIDELWNQVAQYIKPWQDVKAGKTTSADLRRDTISTHAVMLRAIGAMAGYLRSSDPKHWRERLKPLATVDWSKSNPEWRNVVIVGDSVTSSRQSRVGAKEILRRKLGITELVAPSEDTEKVSPPVRGKKATHPISKKAARPALGHSRAA